MDENEFIKNFEQAIDGLAPGLINIDSNFKELDEWDSLQALSLIAMIDSEYGVQISAEELRNSKTLNDLFQIILKKKS